MSQPPDCTETQQLPIERKLEQSCECETEFNPASEYLETMPVRADYLSYVMRAESQHPDFEHSLHCDPPSRYVMHFLRHVLALGIICGFGYLYLEKQKLPVSPDVSLAESDPFAGWDDVDEAPAFQASEPPAPQLNSESHVPEPIPFPVAGHSDLMADPVQWTEKTQKSLTQTLQQSQDSSPRNKALWQEPGTVSHQPTPDKTPQKLTEQSQPAATPAKPEKVEKVEIASTSPPQGKNSVSSEKAVPDKKEAPTSLTNNNVKSVSPQPSTSPPVYREFVLGAGQQVTACVLEESVSQDGLLLSTLFSGLRREWSGQPREDQQLILMVADQQVQVTAEAREQALQSRLKQITPDRVVRVRHGDDTRGWLRFSSEAESMAALMSAPGIYKIAADSKLQPEPSNAEYSVVQVELPRDMATQETSTVRLLSSALGGEWQNQQGSTHSSQALSTLTKPQQDKATSQENTSSFFKNLYEKALGKGEQPVPPPARMDESFLTMFLGESAPFQGNETGEPLTQSPASTTVPNPVERVPAPETGKSQTNSSAIVEFLQPPPGYSPAQSEEPPANYFELPAPPK